MMQQKYASLADVRREKERASRQVGYGYDTLKNHVEDYFIAPERFFVQSSNKYVRCVGYAMTAYKAAKAFRSMFSGKK